MGALLRRTISLLLSRNKRSGLLGEQLTRPFLPFLLRAAAAARRRRAIKETQSLLLPFSFSPLGIPDPVAAEAAIFFLNLA